MIATLLLSGVRRSELLGLLTDDVDLEDRILRVRAATSKSRRDRCIVLSESLWDVLREYQQSRSARQVETRALWVSLRGGQLTVHGLKHIFDKISVASGLAVRAHKMRHTFATRFYQGSRDIVSLQSILGHRKITTTMIYTHALPESTRGSMADNPMNRHF